MKPTNTEWHYYKGTSPHFQGEVYDGTGRTIAVTYHDENGAHSKLIAAAPMLAGALEALLVHIRDGDTLDERHLAAARHALAAAGVVP